MQAKGLGAWRAGKAQFPQSHQDKGVSRFFTKLTGDDGDVGTVPEFLRVGTALPAHGWVESDPALLGRSTLAGPRRGVELLVPRVPAGVAGICSATVTQ